MTKSLDIMALVRRLVAFFCTAVTSSFLQDFIPWSTQFNDDNRNAKESSHCHDSVRLANIGFDKKGENKRGKPPQNLCAVHKES